MKKNKQKNNNTDVNNENDIGNENINNENDANDKNKKENKKNNKKERYLVKDINIRHSGKLYTDGDEIYLTPKEAKDLSEYIKKK